MARSEEHTSELQSHSDLVCRLLLEKKKKKDAQRSLSVNNKTQTENQPVAKLQSNLHMLNYGGLIVGVTVVGDVIQFFFFFNDTATTEIYTLSLHDALPIFWSPRAARRRASSPAASFPCRSR